MPIGACQRLLPHFLISVQHSTPLRPSLWLLISDQSCNSHRAFHFFYSSPASIKVYSKLASREKSRSDVIAAITFRWRLIPLRPWIAVDGEREREREIERDRGGLKKTIPKFQSSPPPCPLFASADYSNKKKLPRGDWTQVHLSRRDIWINLYQIGWMNLAKWSIFCLTNIEASKEYSSKFIVKQTYTAPSTVFTKSRIAWICLV